MKQEFLMLAHTYKASKHAIYSAYMSEKLDGMRCFWDGGISIGHRKSSIPWANVLKPEHVCTGLWSRYGNVIHAPTWWISEMPRIMLDGELFNRSWTRQKLMEVIKPYEPGKEWDQVNFFAFDCPTSVIFNRRMIDNTSFKKYITEEAMAFFDAKKHILSRLPPVGTTYREIVMDYLVHVNNSYAVMLQQYQINSIEEATSFLHQIILRGGEGVMLRMPGSVYMTERVHTLLKIKPFLEDEGIVTGYVGGKGKLENMVGAVILDYKGHRLEMSGYTDAERLLSVPTYAPGEELPEHITCPAFPRGAIVTFRYQNLSKDGIPQNARYWRKYND